MSCGWRPPVARGQRRAIMQPVMSRAKSFLLLACLLPALAVADGIAGSAVEDSPVPDDGAEAPFDRKEEDPNPSEGDSEDESVPLGRLSPQPGAFEQAQRAIRLPGLFKFVARPLEKHVTLSRYPGSVGTRVERAVAQARCLTTLLAIVAPALRCHAPPPPALVVLSRPIDNLPHTS